MRIVGSLWSVPEDRLILAATALKSAGVTTLHWDFSDGVFAYPGGFNPQQARAIADHTGLTGEAHLMSSQTMPLVDEWSEFCDRIAVHVESEDWSQALARIEKRGKKPCLVVSPGTPASAVPSELDLLVMSVIPGMAGSTFQQSSLAKAKSLHDQNSARQIGLDGGVRRECAEAARDAGVNWLVVGTDLVSPGGIDRWSDLISPRDHE